MIFNIPIYVHQVREDANQPFRYEAQPLFVDFPAERNEVLSRAVTRLSREIRKALRRYVRNGQAEELIPWSFSPSYQDQPCDLRLALHRRVASCRFLVVTLKAFDRKLAFTPSLPELWFEVRRREDLRERAAQVLSRHFREQEKKEPGASVPEDYADKGKAWVMTQEVDIDIPIFGPGKTVNQVRKFAEIFSREELSGAEELDKVGECLDWLYPDDLDRAVLREKQVAELMRLLEAPEKRPVLLVGPRHCGKTAIIHECVYRRVAQRKSPHASKHNTWSLSPARLISGMSVVGEWENRLLAIVKEASRKDHVLYFDDLLGLYLAGVCGSSDLSVAQVLKTRVETREVRLLAEITPEAFRILQERDRGFADLFHVIRVEETGEDATLRILLAAMRQMESQCQCIFNLEVLPAILELQRRYVHDTVFPGKAVAFARRLAVGHKHSRVSREDVLKEFQTVSGLSVTFLDGRQKLLRREVEAGIQQELIGQGRGVEVITDSICKAKARLNDPGRPLGAFLFLGPTGVGKTQCAKAASRYLFGEQNRMVRFDMNEYGDAFSAARLIGTFSEPEGLLTSQIRRQPFCVLLLDEIEKAHPDVFDLLLQVLGEGRLTDALGRTADFTNAIVIMTSNLGAREVRTRLGYGESGYTDEAVYREAAQKFFRPEFFNRLDAVVPFAPLSRQEIESITHRLIKDVVGRHGLRQRMCALQISSPAMKRLVDAGYHPQLGARALKRIIEQDLAQPVAACLAGVPPGAPTVIETYEGSQGLCARAQALVNADASGEQAFLSEDPEGVLAKVDAALRRLEARVDRKEPAEPMRAGHILAEHEWYVAAKEQQRYVAILRNRLEARIAHTPVSRSSTRGATWKPRRRSAKLYWLSQHDMRSLLAAKEMATLVDELAKGSDPDDADLRDDILGLVSECALLEAMTSSDAHEGKRVLVCCLATDGPAGESVSFLKKMYEMLCGEIWGFRLESVRADAEPKNAGPANVPAGAERQTGLTGWLLEGLAAFDVFRAEEGTHLFVENDAFRAATLKVMPLSAGSDPIMILADLENRRQEWIEKMGSGLARPGDDPFSFGPVLRLYRVHGMTVDFRTGLAVRGRLPPKMLRRVILAQLPSVPECVQEM